jgi:hypothetical protein
MALAFADIESKFDRVFGFIERDLRRLLCLDPGANFAVAGLAACACETLARYRYGSGEGGDVFLRLLPHGPLQVVGKSVYDILRNGLVHRYDTADLLVDGRAIQLAISWGKERHLSIKDVNGVPNLVLNVRVLCDDLFAEFGEYRRELEERAEVCDRFYTEYRRTGVERVTVPAQIEAWKEIVGDECP